MKPSILSIPINNQDKVVEFTRAPTEMGPVKIAILNDTCGNLIQLVEHLNS